MDRRGFLLAAACVSAAQSSLFAAQVPSGRLGICAFSCHRHWDAARNKLPDAKFSDAISFYRYARSLGADGVQVSLSPNDAATANQVRELCEKSNSYFEADIRLPKDRSELLKFESDVKLALTAGAKVARTVFTGTRRHEAWKSVAEFEAFRRSSIERAMLVAPILERHRCKLAIENHKDFTAGELVEVMHRVGCEWIGVTLDTGNSIALLDDPYEAVSLLAPFAMSVHLKDMAVQSYENGFKLSEVPCGEGMLDLRRIASTIQSANPTVRFNLEMATRDPLLVPCKMADYWSTFPERRNTHKGVSEKLVIENPLRFATPSITGKSISEQLGDEEFNNRVSLEWMHQQLAT